MINPHTAMPAQGVNMNDQKGLISFTSNAEIDKQQEEERKKAMGMQNQPIILELAGHVRRKWNENRDAKTRIEQQMRKDLRQRKGEYEKDDLARIQAQGGTQLFINITNVKCRAAESWITDIQLPPGERPWAADPTPIPELSPDIVQEVSNRVMNQFMMAIQANLQLGRIGPDQIQEEIKKVEAEVLQELRERSKEESDKMELEIDDDLIEGDWYQAIRDVIPDIVTLSAGIIMGPTVKMDKVVRWAEQVDGAPVINVIDKPIRKYERVSPFDIYPSPGARTLQDGDLCHLIRFSRGGLMKLLGVPGFNDFAIRLVLKEFGAGGLREWSTWDQERWGLENRPEEYGANKAETIDCIKYMGSVQGAMLLQWGMNPREVTDPLMEYNVTAYLIGNYIIGAKLNSHPLGRRNYFSASFEKSNDSPWGKGIPEIMADIQKICNGCARALVNNMGHSSGPMMWIYQNKVAPGEQITGISPWKIWKMWGKAGDTGNKPPLGFFQPKSTAEILLKVYQYFFEQASEITGIPAYVYGSSSDVKGAGKTASGLSMLMNAASKGLKAVSSHIDNGIVKPSIEEHWLTIMIFEPQRARGDISILARASEQLIMMEQLQIRRMEFLNTTANPIDMQIIGLHGRAEVLREVVRALKMPVDKIVPERDDMLANYQDTMIQLIIQRVANALGVPPEQIAQMAQDESLDQNPKGGSGPGVNQSAKQLPDGMPAGGQQRMAA